MGLLPNFVCILAGAAVLYCTAKRLIGRFWPAWTAAACWLLCVGVQGMAVFTRMYSLMMLEGIVLCTAMWFCGRRCRRACRRGRSGRVCLRSQWLGR